MSVPNQRSFGALVTVGGAVGAAGRFQLSETFSAGPGELPAPTLIVNLLGAVLLGVVVGRWATRPHPWWGPPLLGAGFAGGFTTMSTVAHEFGALWRDGYAGLATTYVAVTVLGGLAIAVASYQVARR